MAWLTRYGHQPLSEVMRLTLEEVSSYADALGRLVERESPEEE